MDVTAQPRNIALAEFEEALIRDNDTCRIATIGEDGWPHCVPVGYVYEDGQFYIPSSPTSRKISNLRANNKACIVIDQEATGTGVMIQGQVDILEDRRSRNTKTWLQSVTGWTMDQKTVILVVHPVAKTSWQLGGL